ncbi:MAG: DNA/RNA nuclease SfsA [Ectothiorhodospiraceae bacterium]|nr:DNA/RNA nuclease SfsA [Ectothiorhodospiraceae bacterium]
MRFQTGLVPGRLIRRYQRFLADVELENGTRVTAHCPNTGSMLGCRAPGSRVWLSPADDPARRTRFTWEMVEADGGTLVGIHTGRSNALVREALEAGRIPALDGFTEVRAEVQLKQTRSRIDFLLSYSERPPCYLEVKNVTAAVDQGVALFPDAVSTRGTRHLEELAGLVRRGEAGAALVFCVQRADVAEVRPADTIDPAYGKALRAAIRAGVNVYALGARVSPREIALHRPLPVVCP